MSPKVPNKIFFNKLQTKATEFKMIAPSEI